MSPIHVMSKLENQKHSLGFLPTGKKNVTGNAERIITRRAKPFVFLSLVMYYYLKNVAHLNYLIES